MAAGSVTCPSPSFSPCGAMVGQFLRTIKSPKKLLKYTFLCWASYGLVLAPLSRDGVGSTDLDLRRLALFEADKLKGLTTVALEAVLPD